MKKGARTVNYAPTSSYDKANNTYMNDLYNPDEVSIFLQYVNINNEYAWSVINNLPAHGFKWKEGERRLYS